MRLREETYNGIEYSWYVTSPQGGRYELFPVKGFHNKDDVNNAKRWLNATQDVQKIYVHWQKPFCNVKEKADQYVLS